VVRSGNIQSHRCSYLSYPRVMVYNVITVLSVTIIRTGDWTVTGNEEVSWGLVPTRPILMFASIKIGY